MRFAHEPVMLQEVLQILNPQPGEIFVDCTVGGGGHSRAIVEKIMPGGRLVAIDQDKEAIKAAKKNLAAWSDSIHFVQRNFSALKEILTELGIEAVDGILLDIGVSSHQLDAEERGFSYRADAALDMRMSREDSKTGLKSTTCELTRHSRLWRRIMGQTVLTLLLLNAVNGPIETTGRW